MVCHLYGMGAVCNNNKELGHSLLKMLLLTEYDTFTCKHYFFMEAANIVSELLMICGVAGVLRLTREDGKRREVRGNRQLEGVQL
jgi:hypothetical protein